MCSETPGLSVDDGHASRTVLTQLCPVRGFGLFESGLDTTEFSGWSLPAALGAEGVPDGGTWGAGACSSRAVGQPPIWA